jgi:hypothetical protein
MREKCKYGMPPPTTRAEFEHNVYLLVDDIERHIDDEDYLRNRIWAIGDSLEHLHYLPNRRVELINVDERIRNLSNMMDWMKYMPPMKFERKGDKM